MVDKTHSVGKNGMNYLMRMNDVAFVMAIGNSPFVSSLGEKGHPLLSNVLRVKTCGYDGDDYF